MQIEHASPSTISGGIQHPLDVDMGQAEQFVKIGFGLSSGQGGFQSTEFLTPLLSTRQAAQLIQLVPKYGQHFDGEQVASSIQRFAGRVLSVQFGREGSPVLYVDLPHWTQQREGVWTSVGTRISDEENKRLVQELRKVFVDGMYADEFSTDPSEGRRIRIWWHH